MTPSNEDIVRRLLLLAGQDGPVRMERLGRGGNNRVLRVDAPSGSCVVKIYFRHPTDSRDRLASEWSFSRFAWGHGLREIPQPLVADRTLGAALFGFIDGRPLDAGQVNARHVDEAMALFERLNQHRGAPDAAALPIASEACFRWEDHVRTVDHRVARVGGLSGTDPRLAEFARETLPHIWERVRACAARDAADAGLDAHAPLSANDRCISPSDFGFHNALLGPDGRLRFLDFEYAGWDDPAKMVCDFFCQVAAPVPEASFEHVASRASAIADNPKATEARIRALLPVYRVKWACILLNGFLPDGRERRRFAAGDADPGTAEDQLSKARRILAAIP